MQTIFLHHQHLEIFHSKNFKTSYIEYEYHIDHKRVIFHKLVNHLGSIT